MPIDVEKIKEDDKSFLFEVVLSENDNIPPHEVTLDKEYLSKLSGDEPEVFVERSFRFLLDREPKEAIIRRFNLMDIARYYLEYEEEISNIK